MQLFTLGEIGKLDEINDLARTNIRHESLKAGAFGVGSSETNIFILIREALPTDLGKGQLVPVKVNLALDRNGIGPRVSGLGKTHPV